MTQYEKWRKLNNKILHKIVNIIVLNIYITIAFVEYIVGICVCCLYSVYIVNSLITIVCKVVNSLYGWGKLQFP